MHFALVTPAYDSVPDFVSMCVFYQLCISPCIYVYLCNCEDCNLINQAFVWALDWMWPERATLAENQFLRRSSEACLWLSRSLASTSRNLQMSDNQAQEAPPPYADVSGRVTLEKRPSRPPQDDRSTTKARREMDSFGEHSS